MNKRPETDYETVHGPNYSPPTDIDFYLRSHGRAFEKLDMF